MALLPMAESCPKDVDLEQVRKIIKEKNLVGLSNNTKWNELISLIRNNKWFVSHRSKWVSGFISDWENDWYYRLPFPFIGVEWMDLEFIKHDFITHGGSTKEVAVCFKIEILSALRDINFEFQASNDFVRIWGYGPKCTHQFASTDA